MTLSYSAPQNEHPFAHYVRILGKGKTGTRSLSFEEAEEAFSMILNGQVEPLQLGAFLMLLRVKEESAEELAGFVSACRLQFELPSSIDPAMIPDLDWSSYAGKKSQQPWYILAAWLLSQSGFSILMHGADGHTAGRLYTEPVLNELGLPVVDSLEMASTLLQHHNLVYLPLRHFCPSVHDIMQFRHLLGLRSPVNTLTRMLNPLRASHSIQSVFHPAYMRLHQGADRILGQTSAMVFKGDSGEVEIKPQADTRLTLLRDAESVEVIWPRSLQERPEAATELSAAALSHVWVGTTNDAYGELAVTHTAAAALLLMDSSLTTATALQKAQDMWAERERDSLPCL